jgi:hypothetical protein
MREEVRAPREEFIETVDVWSLRQIRWPVMRALCRRYVEERELRLYERDLLATRRWSVVRCVPQPSASGDCPAHLFDVYGIAT